MFYYIISKCAENEKVILKSNKKLSVVKKYPLIIKWSPTKHFSKIHLLPTRLSLLPISEFVLNEKFQRNASKFAIFYVFQSCFLLGLCRHRPGHSLGEKNKVVRNEKRKKLHEFSYAKNLANFEAFRWNFSSSTNPQIVKLTTTL